MSRARVSGENTGLPAKGFFRKEKVSQASTGLNQPTRRCQEIKLLATPRINKEAEAWYMQLYFYSAVVQAVRGLDNARGVGGEGEWRRFTEFFSLEL